MKRLLKLSAATLLIGTTAVAVLGRPRVDAILSEAHTAVTDLIDDQIDPRTELAAQLDGLRKRLPVELDQLRAEYGKIEHEAEQIRKESLVARRVVELANADALALDAKIEAAATLAAQFPDSPLAAVDAKRSRRQFERARSTATQYAEAAGEHDVRLTLLESQLDRLTALIVEREEEFEAFQDQAKRLEAEVAAIERNDRLIEWCEDRDIDCWGESKYEAASLEELLSNFESVRGEQSETLARLTVESTARNYERAARREASLALATQPR